MSGCWFRFNMKKQGELGKTGYYVAKYRVSPLGKDYLKWEHDDQDGGAGDDVNGIDRLQLTLEKQ